MNKEKVFGFWNGCPCSIGYAIEEIDFPFFYDDYLITYKDFERELQDHKNRGYVKVYTTCTNCQSSSAYTLFKEKDLNLVLKSFPWLLQRRANYEFFKERKYYDED
jgi:hypothetical protein